MFRQTLSGAAWNWFDDLDPKSGDTFEELSQKFLEEFLQQKRYAKDPTEIHGIKRRFTEGLQAFMNRFKPKSSHIKDVPPVLRISAFMHGHRNPELANKLNDKILKTMDEMFERVRAFIRGEVMAGSAVVARAPQWDKGNVHTGWSRGQERIKGRRGPRESGGSRKRPYNVEGPRFTEETVFSAIPRNNTDAPIILEGKIEGFRVRRIYVDGGSSSEIMYEQCFKIFGANTKSTLRKSSAPLVGFSGEIYHRLGLIDLKVTMGELGKDKTVLLEFAIVKCRSPYNAS
ncbi:reverse transcriptase domain-containing protein [Tanacetum coccineum]